MNPVCRSIPSGVFPNADLCEWLSQQPGVNLNEKITPRELHAAATTALEQEWRQIFLKDHYLLKEAHQPLAEGLYDSFHFLPPWLPKPLARMSRDEKRILQNFIITGQRVEYNPDKAIQEDSLLDILKIGVASCVGESNLFYFVKKIVEGKNTGFIEVYGDERNTPYFHIATRGDEGPYDPSYAVPLASSYRWHDLEPMDQWAISLMNTGISKMERGSIDLSRYLIAYGLRAYELAPDYSRVRENLEDFIYHSRQ